jgi:dTDP-4-amino-4,6-dideoxygalactose transaminase
MKMLNDEVNSSVLETLRKQRLFRYDCNTPEESEVSIFEKKFAKYVGSQYAVAMNSCSSALFVALLCAGIKPGDKVAIPAFTFIAVPSSIVHAGALPVLIEVTEDYVMDLNDFEAKVADGSVRALMLSYMRGRIPNLDKVIEICNKYNIIFLEDAAHSLGVLYSQTQTGTFGLAGAFSAQSYKMIDGGEGGVLVTNDKNIAFKAMLYAGCYEHNWEKHFGTKDDTAKLKELTNSIPAYNFRMSNLTASVLNPQLKKIEGRVEFLNNNYVALVDILLKSKNIRIPAFAENIRPAADSIQWEFINLSEHQINQIIAGLATKGIEINVFNGSNARSFWNWMFFEQKEKCPFTKELIQKTVDYRLRGDLSFGDIDLIGNTILKEICNVL